MLDAQLMFEGSVASTGVVSGTAITASRVGTNVIDFLIERDVGVYNDLALNVEITTAFTAAGAATLTLDYQTSADNSTFVTLLSTGAIPKASLTVGAKILSIQVPRFMYPDTGTPNRYHRLNWTVATGPMTAGAVVAYLAPGADQNAFIVYPRGYSIGA